MPVPSKNLYWIDSAVGRTRCFFKLTCRGWMPWDSNSNYLNIYSYVLFDILVVRTHRCSNDITLRLLFLHGDKKLVDLRRYEVGSLRKLNSIANHQFEAPNNFFFLIDSWLNHVI